MVKRVFSGDGAIDADQTPGGLAFWRPCFSTGRAHRPNEYLRKPGTSDADYFEGLAIRDLRCTFAITRRTNLGYLSCPAKFA
jgi:hypothetical protein